MILFRKIGSAFGLYRRNGLSDVARLARSQAVGYARSNGVRPLSAAKKALLLGGMLNETSEFSVVPVDLSDTRRVRGSWLFPYLRGRFRDVASMADDAGRLSPVETIILADCLFRTWEFGRLAEQLPGWGGTLAGTKFAKRVFQLSKRVALRTGRLREAAAGLGGAGGDVADCLLRGDVLDACGRMEEASQAYAQALRRLTFSPTLRLSYAFHLMKTGHVLEGLSNWGVADRIFGTYPLRKHRPQWTGEALDGRTILVIFEHGLGDMIQFSRFLLLLRRGQPSARIIARMPKVLIGLLRRSFAEILFVAEEDREPDYDVFIPSILLAVVLEAPDLDPRENYLELSRTADSGFAPRPSGRKRVGVCWRGHPRQYELTRSVPIEQFARLFALESVDFVVLLNALTQSETAFLRSFPRVCVPPIADFVELGALIDGCDLVVSVDTAVVHVAAAGGRPVIVLSRPDSCWRWGAAGSGSPWYSTVEVLRHEVDMDWNRMLDRASQRIEARLSPAATGDVAAAG